jgi:hypothetical protein
MCPERKWHRGEIIDERHGVAVFGEINPAQVKLAGVAGFRADVRELLLKSDCG